MHGWICGYLDALSVSISPNRNPNPNWRSKYSPQRAALRPFPASEGVRVRDRGRDRVRSDLAPGDQGDVKAATGHALALILSPYLKGVREAYRLPRAVHRIDRETSGLVSRPTLSPTPTITLSVTMSITITISTTPALTPPLPLTGFSQVVVAKTVPAFRFLSEAI